MTIERVQDVGAGAELIADICVIGSGAAGIALARRLDAQPVRVVVLEAGGERRTPDTESEDFAVEYVGRPSRDDIDARGRWYGGSTNLWFGRIAVPDRIDFEVRPWVPHSGWPIAYDEVVPWLDVAADLLGVRHFEQIDPRRWPPNETIDAFTDRGRTDLRVFLWAEGMLMGPEAHALLHASSNVRLLLGATVTDLVVGDASTTIAAVGAVGPAGETVRVSASTFVLAAGGLENPRLLLASSDRLSAGIGNQHDNVGRYYLDHPRCEGSGRANLRDLGDGPLNAVSLLGEKADSAYGQVQLRVTFDEEYQRSEHLLNHSLHAHLVSDAQMSPGYESARRLRDAARQRRLPPAAQLRGDFAASVRAVPSLARLGVGKLARRPPRPVELIVVDQMEQEPDPESRVFLQRHRRDRYGLPMLAVDWRVGASTFRSQRRLHELVGGLLAAAGITTFESQVLDDRQDALDILDMRHPSGTTRMSAAPADGVVDADCRVHGVDNLYVAGSSVFPTTGHFNPTLLIVALAARLADHLLGRGLGPTIQVR